MRFLVLGGAGMLGHKLWQELRHSGETFATLRKPFATYAELGLFEQDRSIDRIDVTAPQDLRRAFDTARPDVVFNAVGIIKQLKQAHDPITSIVINSLLPHQLAEICSEYGARLIHISTDCVFSGLKGSYTEEDIPDPVDLYGRSKLLGEVDSGDCVTVRTSMIGRELGTQSGLVEWFLSQRRGTVRGFERAVFTGFTTLALARILADLAKRHTDIRGIVHISSDPVNKYELLRLIGDEYGADVTIQRDIEFQCDRSLDSSRFRDRTGFSPPSWPEMIRDMKNDPTPYEVWRDK
jgi:dTDP-4-dehydrorhamnose reductase